MSSTPDRNVIILREVAQLKVEMKKLGERYRAQVAKNARDIQVLKLRVAILDQRTGTFKTLKNGK